MSKKVFLTRKIDQAGIDLLKKKGYQITVAPQDKPIARATLLKKVAGVDAVVSLLTDKIDEEFFKAAGPQLKIVANNAVGYNNIDLAAAKRHGVMIANTPAVSGYSVAEHTITLMLAITHQLKEADDFVRQDKYQGWDPRLFIHIELQGKTLGIIGTGAIGYEVAKMAYNGFGMNIIYHDIVPNTALEKKCKAKKVSLAILLKQSDVVSLHVPLLPSTRHLIGAQQFKQMKKTAYLINTARGPVVDEKALVAALKNNDIAGAAIDVFENEPKHTPGLAKLKNVIMTPHIASATVEARRRMSVTSAENVIAALSGKKPKGLITK